MALKGNLSDTSVIQLLNLIHLARKTGRLVLEREGETARVAFRQGKLAWAQLGSEESGLATILQRSRKITRNQYHLLKNKAPDMPDKELGLLLVNAGYLTQADILDSLQQYYAQVVQRLFSWMEGSFAFEAGEAPPEECITVSLGLENLIIEGMRQTEEREQLQNEIPSLDVAVKFRERPEASIQNIQLSKEEWRVISYINPKNSLRQIGQAARMGDFEIRRLVHGLLEAGIVELVPADEAAAGQPPAAGEEGQGSVVDRLLHRIRSI